MAAIVLEQVSKLFGEKAAVKELDLEIADGEFVIVVGPSGCGKTTTLRMIAGFERPTYGVIRMDERVMNNVAPKDRNIAMVFQNYALFPHMTVRQNLAFGMKIRRESKLQIRKQVEEISGMLGIDSMLDRKPGELSGGERQRVALGRALLRRPQAFLLDEPLSNLDAALRAQMRLELKRIHAQFPVTTVYVTHDQVEAMTMADRIALMSDGLLQQYGPPDEIYGKPANLFAAGFIGSPKINLVPGRFRDDGGTPGIEFLSLVVGFPQEGLGALSGQELTVGLRPEDVGPAGHSGRRMPVVRGTIEVVEPLGAETHVAARVADQLLMCRFPGRAAVEVGTAIDLEINITNIRVFDQAGALCVAAGPDVLSQAARSASPIAESTR
jgi:multiple sugar transport system ATP-binding protein